MRCFACGEGDARSMKYWLDGMAVCKECFDKYDDAEEDTTEVEPNKCQTTICKDCDEFNTCVIVAQALGVAPSYVLKVWYQFGHPKTLFDQFMGTTMDNVVEKYLLWGDSFYDGECFIDRIEIWVAGHHTRTILADTPHHHF